MSAFKESTEKFLISSENSSSSKSVVYKYKNTNDLIVCAVTAPGLLYLYKPIIHMEDFVSVSSFNVNGKVYELFAVFDGHRGKDARTGIKKGVAKECVSYLPKIIKKNLKINNTDIKGLLTKSFEEANKEHFLKDLIKFPENVGSTAILMLKIDKKIYIANLGDSRAVICKKGKTYFETKDCDWTKSSEQKRIGINKNKLTYDLKTVYGNKKFILNGKFLNGEKWNIGTSRSFGDYHFKLDSNNPPVTAKPCIDSFTIDEDMKLIIIASDGIWKNDKGLLSDHYISKFIEIAKKQTSQNGEVCLEITCKEFVRWCMIDQLKLGYKNHGDNISLIAIGVLNGKSKKEWFRDIKNWKGKYGNSDLISMDPHDAVQNDYYDFSDSEDCKIDFIKLKIVKQ
ncbi:hypothetical protein RclHR1_11300011 [Rhizophagus clarus]|uniref:PPM-type phosphatase domain-containing protein n=1 Tax=Rhizophagus clarus TaxID=94130 RepID=A0A2Z6Q8H1_9GLOM|nr:hypothetical protein RclHR1_11300011 [Rhizophagus clarus]